MRLFDGKIIHNAAHNSTISVMSFSHLLYITNALFSDIPLVECGDPKKATHEGES